MKKFKTNIKTKTNKINQIKIMKIILLVCKNKINKIIIKNS
jgi:hypothetical protein